MIERNSLGFDTAANRAWHHSRFVRPGLARGVAAHDTAKPGAHPR
jgi:hypothetical protein